MPTHFTSGLQVLNQYLIDIPNGASWKVQEGTGIHWIRVSEEHCSLLKDLLRNHLVTHKVSKVKNANDFCILIERKETEELLKNVQLHETINQAAREGNVATLKMLFPGPNPNWKDIDDEDDDYRLPGATALHYAAEAGKTDAIELLIQQGCEVNADDGSFWTPLLYAIDDGHLDAVKSLLKHGANPLQPGKTPGRAPGVNSGVLPLHHAVGASASNTDNARFEILRVLLASVKEKNPSIDLNTIRGAASPIHTAKVSLVDYVGTIGKPNPEGEKTTLEILKNAGVNVEAKATFRAYR